MRFNTLLCLVLLGLTLIFKPKQPYSRTFVLLFHLSILLSFLLSIATFVESIGSIDRMAPITPLLLSLTALCFFFRVRTPHRLRLWQGIALFNLLMSTLQALNLLLDPLITTGLILLNVSFMLSNSSAGYMADIRQPRRLPLLAILALALLGFLTRLGLSYGVYDRGVDAILIATLGSILILVWLIRHKPQDESTALAQNLKLLIDYGPGAVAMFDRDMRYIWASQRWISDYRLDPNAIIGRSHYDIFPELSEAWRQVHRDCMEGAVKNREEELFERADGTKSWLRWEVRPWNKHDGSIGGIVIFTEDITKKKEAAERLVNLSRELEGKVRERTKELELQSTVVRTMAEGVCLIRASDGIIVYANPKFAEMFGYDPGELEGQHVSIVNYDGPSQEAYGISLRLMESIRKSGSYSYEIHNRKKDGTAFWCRATTSLTEHPLFGSVMVAVQEDITFRKKHEEDLIRSEKRYRDVIELASDGIFETGPEGKYIDVNPAGCAMLGYTRDELVGRSASDLVADADRERLLRTLQEFRRSGASQVIMEFGVKRKDGSILPSEVGVKALPDGRRISFLRDLTFRKRAEVTLSASEKKYRSLVEGAYDSIVVADSDGKMVLVNEQLGRKFGYTQEELIGQPIEILMPERYRDRHIVSRKDYESDPHARPMGQRLDLYARKKDGSEFPVDISLSPTHADSGLHITAIIRDITERKRYEERQAFLSQISKNLEEVMNVEDRARIIVDTLIARLADNAIVRVFEGEQLRAKAAATRDPENRELFLKVVYQGEGMQGPHGALHAAARRKAVVIEDARSMIVDNEEADPQLKAIVHRMGITSYVSLPLLVRDNVIGTLAVSMSVSGRRLSGGDVTFLEIVANRCALAIENARLYRQAQLGRLVADSLPALVAYWDREERCRFANRAYVDWFGFTAEQMIGRTMKEVLGETLYQTNSGFIKSALAGKTQHFERDLNLFSTGELRHTQAVYFPEIIEGTVRGFFVLVTDVTELKQAEMNALAEKERAEAAVRLREEVLGIVSHDLRNPLAAIDMAAQILTSTDLSKELTQQYVRRLQASAKSMQTLIADLLDFGKIQGGAFTVDREPTDVEETVLEAMDAMHIRAMVKGIQLKVDIPSNLPAVLAEKRRIVQVIWNLVGNAIKFTPPGGRVAFTVTRENNTVQFSVIDSGPGIPEEDLPKVFDRFWQDRKTATLGTGLGLAIAKGIITAHGGQIGARSIEGQGAVFHFTLPITTQEPSLMPGKKAAQEAKSEIRTLLHDIHVLIVDDAEENLALLRFMLEKAGARVTEAITIHEALQKITDDRPDVMITDIEMPDGSGYDLIDKVHHSEDPGLPIAALTGYTSERDLKKIADAGFDACLSKPISIQKLLASVKDLAHRPLH